MSNSQTKHYDPYKHLRDLPLNIQLAVCLVASVLRRIEAKQEHLDGKENAKATKLGIGIHAYPKTECREAKFLRQSRSSITRSETILSTIARRRASQLYRGLRLNLKSSSFLKAFCWAWVITDLASSMKLS